MVMLMTDDKKIPQNRIAELRKEKNLSQAELAKKTGLTRQAISLYEISKREPKLEIWIKLADFFDVPITYLQGITSEKLNAVDDVKLFLNKLSSLEIKKENKEDWLVLQKAILKVIQKHFNVKETKAFEGILKRINTDGVAFDALIYVVTTYPLLISEYQRTGNYENEVATIVDTLSEWQSKRNSASKKKS